MVTRRMRLLLALLIINGCVATYAGLTGPPYFWFWLWVILCGWLIYEISLDLYEQWWIRTREGGPPKV